MPKFLICGAYSVEGNKGVMKSGGSARREAVRKAVESVGGKLESFYFALGDDDFVITIDVPDAVSGAAVGMAAAAGGGVKGTRTTLLLTPEDVDQATKKAVTYRPPGQ